MTLDDLLALLIFGLLPFAWFSTGVLWWAKRKPPRSGALTERAVIALVIAVFLTSITVIVLNTEADRVFFPAEVARVAFRLSVLALGFIPIAWCVLFFAGKLGDGGEG